MMIKQASTDDAELILYFIKALAEAEDFPFDITVTEEDLRQNLLSANSNAEAVICYEQGEPCGFAVFYYTFSTTTGKKGLHLDDLFIEPSYQGQGFGKQVLAYLADIAKEQGCGRFEWWALKTNEPAIKFYKKLGAQQLDELSVFRLDEKGIANMFS